MQNELDHGGGHQFLTHLSGRQAYILKCQMENTDLLNRFSPVLRSYIRNKQNHRIGILIAFRNKDDAPWKNRII